MSCSHEEGKGSGIDSPDPPLFSKRERNEETVTGRITIYLNDRMVSLYRGMRVRHALTPEQVCLVESGTAEVRDSYGHVVGLDGALSDGQRLTLQRKNE